MNKAEIMNLVQFTALDCNMSGRDAMAVSGITIEAVNKRILPLVEALAESNEKLIEALRKAAHYIKTKRWFEEGEISEVFDAITEHAERMAKLKGDK